MAHHLRKFALAAAAAAAVAVVPVMAATSASATEYNINATDNGYICPQDGGGDMCLWYSPNLTGAYWATNTSFVDLDTSGAKFTHTNYGGSSGNGATVANDAGSMADGTTNCTVDTYVYGNGTGDYDHLSAGWSGNLSSGLHNNEGSIAYYCS